MNWSWRRIGLLLLAVGGLVLAQRWWSSRTLADLGADLEVARAEMKLGNYREAREISHRVLRLDPRNADAEFVLAECFTREGRLDEAFACYERVLAAPQADDDTRTIALQCAGEILLDRGDWRRAEQFFRQAVKHDPYFPPAHNRLAFLLGLEGRRWESLPHLVELVKQDRFSVFHLLLLANPRQNLVIEEFTDRALRFDPQFALPLIPHAKAALEEGRLDQAEELIGRLLAYDPRQIEIKALEGALYLARRDRDAFLRWSNSLDLQQESHPECWLLRARWARYNGEAEVAIRCFAEAFYRDPNSLEACQGLTQLLAQANERPQAIDYFKQRTTLLEQLEGNSHFLHTNQQNVRLMKLAFVCCDWLERYWEAWGWCRAALEVDPNLEWARTQQEDIGKHLIYDVPQTIMFKNISDWNYAKYPLPAWRAGGGLAAQPRSEQAGTRISFRELSAEIGLEFHYECGNQGDPADIRDGRRMYEVPGGGVAALDYDLDGWPDVYFAQGTRRHDAPAAHPMTDRLFRNVSGQRFQDVTAFCGIAELAYSHGVAVGDFNNDGFPDLFVGNLGANRLYMNNGDGTFSDATAGLPPVESVWTTSTAIADLNGDGNPDLYEVNYLKKEAYERRCDFDGYLRACNPRIFPAERDRVFLSNGDGTFREGSAGLPAEADDGRGLGILIADYFGTGGLQIFLANDMSANSFFTLDRRPRSGEFGLRDEALIRGLAFDHRGRAQACMGVAFGDLDGDRTFDLFVTNFYGDHNTLYLQDQEMFSDLSHSSNLAALSYYTLGFGAQALDANLNGHLDLFVANGHIDDFTYQDLPYRMRPQLFANDGAGRFEELPARQAGPYFERELLGRGVARLDWNRDGREDLLVSHLDYPNVLLSNESTAAGQSLRLSFTGTSLSRDAVGTWVEVLDGESVRIAQVSAGSGYLASNEQVLVLTVLQEDPVTIRVRWPDQRQVEFAGLHPGAHYRIVEGFDGAHLMP